MVTYPYLSNNILMSFSILLAVSTSICAPVLNNYTCRRPHRSSRRTLSPSIYAEFVLMISSNFISVCIMN